jgi:hypothetical protein
MRSASVCKRLTIEGLSCGREGSIGMRRSSVSMLQPELERIAGCAFEFDNSVEDVTFFADLSIYRLFEKVVLGFIRPQQFMLSVFTYGSPALDRCSPP